MKSQVSIGIAVLVLLVVLGAGWYAYTHQEMFGMHATVTPSSIASTTLPVGFARGSIEILSDSGFTLTLANGNTRTIVTSATTTIYNYSAASSTPTIQTSDQLSVSEPVLVLGNADSATAPIDANVIVTGVLPPRGKVRSTLESSGIPITPSVQATPPHMEAPAGTN